MPGVQDRVVIVTGAGGGLGREYALTLAKEGACVVVNDLGGARDGTGAGHNMADHVVAEIKEAGGRAVANYDSVAEAEGAANIVKTALDEFGKVDGVVSNAGILRDGTFHKMTDENWDAVLKVHLYGGYNVIRAAWPHFREQSFGRVVVATSTSGLFGNFGQANYGAAKLGLVGLINTLAQEGAKYNIKANAIAPIAATRMTEDILPPEVLKNLTPEYVAPNAVAEAARERGYEYIAITDHSKSLAMTNGLDEARATAFAQRVRQWNAEAQGIRVLSGLECDILRDGSLDLADDALAELDYVVASVHSYMNLEPAEMTDRLLRAIESPRVRAIGHPTGRILLHRDPYPFDFERVAAEAARRNVWLEINASPERLDLHGPLLRIARAKGARFVISTDAHHPKHLLNMPFGVATARRGWLTAADVVNTLPYEQFRRAAKGEL